MEHANTLFAPRRPLLPLLNATEAAKLVAESTGKACTRQSIQHHAKRGKFPKSLVKGPPVRYHSETLVLEYINNVAHRISNPPDPEKLKALEVDPVAEHVIKTAYTRQKIDDLLNQLPEDARSLPGGIATAVGFDINQAKAWKEVEAARRLQIQRLADEGTYTETAKIQAEWEKALVVINRSVMAIPSRLKADRPDTPLSTIELLRDICREALEKASAAMEDGTY